MDNKRVIALGFFDGMHIGHARLLHKAAERAAELEAVPSVLSFDDHPDRMISGKSVPLINSPFDRADLIRRAFGIDDLIFLHFDEKLMRMPWDEFLVWLQRDFGAVHLVAGYDFRFGYRGAGTAERLMEKCAALGMGCDIIPQVNIDGVTVSSTYIRELLQAGEMERANEFLGHRHFFADNVRYGYRLGRKLGMPTVNMRFEDGVVVPKHGVYASRAVILETGERHDAVTNIGVRPTVSGDDRVSVETHLFGFDGNLYGKRLRIEFCRFMRPEMKFASTEELGARARRDAEDVKAYFEELRRT